MARGFGFIVEDRFFRGVVNLLGGARNDPAMRARIAEQDRQETARIGRWLAELENFYLTLEKADPTTPDRRTSPKQDAALGRDSSLKLLRLAQRRIDSGVTMSGWSKEIRELKRLHAQISIALGPASSHGLKSRENQRSMREKARDSRAAERQRVEKEIRRRFAQISAASPRRSFTWCCEQVGKHLVVNGRPLVMSGRNVRRYVESPTPRKKK